MRHVRLREFLVGVEGLAIMRGLFTGSDEALERRIQEVQRIVGPDEEATFTLGTDVPELAVTQGYSRWSTTYDAPGNPLVSAEQPVVWELLDRLAPGRVLDAACGTGRHARHLVEQGHEVVGIDATAEMLAVARQHVPGARFEPGDVCDLPFTDGAFDAAVCALALEHVRELNRAVAELARVVRPGGTVIISGLHPVVTALGAAAFFRDAAGESGVVRGYAHSHADYLDAFSGAGLQLRRCVEPRFGPDEVGMQQPAAALVPEATEAAYLDLPAVLIWDLTKSRATR
jgi:ubiquinone/menaquinone biosynthesis C-methylase UbiE